jgi:acylphosphatase
MTRATPSRTVHVRIEGRVQGVAFRAWAKDSAHSLGLTGWVRNRRDGSVETLFSGSPEGVEAMLEACTSGPPGALVSNVEIVSEGGESPPGFEIMPTV